jgi:hypothetical protein
LGLVRVLDGLDCGWGLRGRLVLALVERLAVLGCAQGSVLVLGMLGLGRPELLQLGLAGLAGLCGCGLGLQQLMGWVLKRLERVQLHSTRHLELVQLGLVRLCAFYDQVHWLHLVLVELFLRLGENPLGLELLLAQLRLVLVQQILQILLAYGLRPGRHERL